MNNTKRLQDMPEDVEVTLMISCERDVTQSSVHTFHLFKGSPLRQLFERQEIWEQSFAYAKEQKGA